MTKLWKKVTPIPPEMNGNGFLWVCKNCGDSFVTVLAYPKSACPNCGEKEEQEDKEE